MKLLKQIISFSMFFLLISCADYKTTNQKNSKDKKFYNSSGFALIYDEILFDEGIISKKIINKSKFVMHYFLKKNTPLKIVNPQNSLFIETKVYKKSNYPKLFNILISKDIAETLELDPNNPYVEVFEVKKNKKFIAKEGNIFEEEKRVADTVPVNKIEIDDLSEEKSTIKRELKNNKKFIIIVSDFYYLTSANNLKSELYKQTKINNFAIKKINNNKYRLLAGPFKNFEALKSTYISLNNLGFDELNIYRE